MPARIETGSISIGGLLRMGTTYKVPLFQRDYSWTEEEYGRLWDDIIECIDNNRVDYFLGSVVVNDATPAQHLVIDGQQRLASISILVCALRDVASAQNLNDIGTSLERDFLGRVDYSTGEAVPRLELNKTNKRFYIEHIFSRSTLDQLREQARNAANDRSNRQMAAAYVYYREKVEAKVAAGIAIQRVIADIIGAVDNRLITIRIAVKEDNDAFLLFETLNDRGLSLSVSDLLKNYIFSQARDQLSEVQENWEDMVSSLGPHTIATFLRHYWLSKEGVIRDKDLYRRIAQANTTTAQVVTLSRNLRDAAALYGCFTDIDNSFWNMYEIRERSKIKSWLEQISLFNVSQCYPLMLAALDANAQNFDGVLRMIVIFSFRYSIIGGLGPGNVEKAYSNAAIYVRRNPNCSIREVFERVQHLYPNDDDFKRMFGEKSVTKAAIARYILARINDHLTAGLGLVTDRNPDDQNLEHILPKKFSAEWAEKFQGNHDRTRSYVDRLGNMTLLQARYNRGVGNALFERKKREAYQNAPLRITEPLLQNEDWDAEAIERRQRWMADNAATIWRLDY